jgi:lipopolysaccharide transport system ATP-binding protein
MHRKEIQGKFDAIVDFSGVEKFLDTPVKRYSSGMYVRLAFAIAAHVEADILLVDEVLAVGDAEFQKRCLGIMGDVARAGRTVLFVSHNLTALRNLCTTGILLTAGEVEAHGEIGHVLDRYAAGRALDRSGIVEMQEDPNLPATIRQVALVTEGASQTANASVGSAFRIRTRVMVREAGTEFGVFLHCHDENRVRVFSTGSFFNAQLHGLTLSAGEHEFDCSIPGNLLNAGEYAVDVILVRNRTDIVTSESSLLTFRISDEPLGVEGWNWPVVGVIRPKLDWGYREIGREP